MTAYVPFRPRKPREVDEPLRKMTIEFIADYLPTGNMRGEKVTISQGAAWILISSGYAKGAVTNG